MNVPPNPIAANALQFQRYRKSQDRIAWRTELRRRHKQQQQRDRRIAAAVQRRSMMNDAANLAAALTKQQAVISAPSLRKRKPT